MSIVAALLLTSGAAAQPVTFPEAFQGVWDFDAKACAGGHQDSRITIKPGEVIYWESGGTPTEIFSADERDIRMTLAISGEGEDWKSQMRYVLDHSGTKLFAEELPRSGEPYYSTKWFYTKCPSGTKADR